jgi:hypothetical protein
MHSDSVSSAFERRIAFSRIRERMTSASVGLGTQLGASGKAYKVKLGLRTGQLRKLVMPLGRTQ